MHKKLLVIVLSIFLSSCATQYLIATNFHQSLKKGMTKEQFLASWEQPSRKALGGNMHVSSRNFAIKNNQWEILIYNV